MTQSLELKEMGLMPMTETEITNIDGGGLWDHVLGWVIGKVLDNSDVILESANATKRTFAAHPEIFQK